MAEKEPGLGFLQQIDWFTEEAIGDDLFLRWLPVTEAVRRDDESETQFAQFVGWEHLDLIVEAIKTEGADKIEKIATILIELNKPGQVNAAVVACFGLDVDGEEPGIVDHLPLEELQIDRQAIRLPDEVGFDSQARIWSTVSWSIEQHGRKTSGRRPYVPAGRRPT